MDLLASTEHDGVGLDFLSITEMQSLRAVAREAATPCIRGSVTGRPCSWQRLEPGEEKALWRYPCNKKRKPC